MAEVPHWRVDVHCGGHEREGRALSDRAGRHTAPSNDAFDRDLRRRNPAWGVRDLEEVAACANENGFGAPEIVEMPANNLSLIFRRS